MAKASDATKALEKAPETRPAAVAPVESLLKTPGIKARFEDILGKKAPGFMSSIISAVNANQALKACDPRTVIASAAVAAALDLPINPSLGFAHIVPYSGKAQFQMGWKGFVQLGMRSGQYERMNVSEVYEDEIDFWNPITGEFKLREQSEWHQRSGNQRDKIVGYVAFFKLLNGFQMYLYMTKAQVEAHGKEYSRAYSNGPWKTKFDAMAKKTVLKLLLSKFGILSIEMQKAIQTDQAIVHEGERLEFADSNNPSTMDALPEGGTASDEVLPDAPAPAPESDPELNYIPD